MRYVNPKELKDKRACAGLRADLKICILRTDCVQIERKLPRTCVNEGLIPYPCQVLLNEFFECKRQVIDQRTRFRGIRGY